MVKKKYRARKQLTQWHEENNGSRKTKKKHREEAEKEAPRQRKYEKK